MTKCIVLLFLLKIWQVDTLHEQCNLAVCSQRPRSKFLSLGPILCKDYLNHTVSISHDQFVGVQKEWPLGQDIMK